MHRAATDTDYPLVLLTGRGTSAQWHTGKQEPARAAILRKLAPCGSLTVELHPRLDAEHHVASKTEIVVQVENQLAPRLRREAVAVVTSTVQRGQIFLPMHFETVNRLTFPSFDPHSRQPSYKACAVAVAKR